MRSSILKCESDPRDTLTFNGEYPTAELIARGSRGFVSLYPSRNDLIRFRKAIDEYLKATRKEKR